ncbi:MAG: hypothetical protein Q9207_007801 [Kuettlingeria erythrocarpa]
MLSPSLALSGLFILGAVARPPKSQSIFRAADEGPCSAVHIVGVRGTLESTGFGAIQKVVDALKPKLSGMDEYALDYPASGISIGEDGEPEYNFPEYSASEAQGYGALKTHLNDYTLFPRAYLGYCKDLANEWRSYCDAGDIFCDVPGRSVDVHLGYVQEYLDDIVDFIVGRVQADRGTVRKCALGSKEM